MKVCRIFATFILLSMSLFGGQSWAQTEGDDAYDPFADYSEFDENSDEEEDINFFRHGRFFSLGFAIGHRSFTGALKNIYSSNPTFGVYMTYFFDLRTALQVGFLTGDHSLEVSEFGETISGNVAFTLMNIDIKHYLNTQNITRGLADLNPYFFGGFAQVYRTKTIPGYTGEAKDNTMGLNLGAGVEIPLNRKKSYFGVQMSYRYFNFKDESSIIHMPQTDRDTNIKPAGDSYDILVILGTNF